MPGTIKGVIFIRTRMHQNNISFSITAAQSHVQVFFETPEYTANADAIGTPRFLEAIHILGLEKKTRLCICLGVVRQNSGDSTKGVDPDLSSFSLYSGKALSVLGHGQHITVATQNLCVMKMY